MEGGRRRNKKTESERLQLMRCEQTGLGAGRADDALLLQPLLPVLLHALQQLDVVVFLEDKRPRGAASAGGERGGDGGERARREAAPPPDDDGGLTLVVLATAAADASERHWHGSLLGLPSSRCGRRRMLRRQLLRRYRYRRRLGRWAASSERPYLGDNGHHRVIGAGRTQPSPSLPLPGSSTKRQEGGEAGATKKQARKHAALAQRKSPPLIRTILFRPSQPHKS